MTSSLSAIHSRRRLFRFAGFGFGILAVIGVIYGVIFWFSNGAFPGDTFTYYLAGLRLDQGGRLYDLRPNDVWLFTGREFPLYGPPLIAVPWRVLALIPDAWGVIIWLVAMIFCGLWAVLWVLIGTRGWAGLLVLALVPSLTLLLGVGNVDAAILLGIVASWALAAGGSVRRLGLLIGLLVSIKLTPAVLVVWLITTRRWAALRWAVGTMAVLAVIAAIGTDALIWGRYGEVMTAGATNGRTWTLVILVVGFIGVAVLRNHERWSFALAVVLIPFGSPQAAGHTWTLLLGALAPWCAPLAGGPRRRSLAPDSTQAASTLGQVAR